MKCFIHQNAPYMKNKKTYLHFLETLRILIDFQLNNLHDMQSVENIANGMPTVELLMIVKFIKISLVLRR